MAESRDDSVMADVELQKLEYQIKLKKIEIQTQTDAKNALAKTIEKDKNFLYVAKQDLARLQLLKSLEVERLELLKTKLESYGNDQPPKFIGRDKSETDELELQLADKRKELERLRASVESKKLELLIRKNRVNAKIRRSQIVLAAETQKRDAAEQKIAELRGELAKFRF